MFNLIINSYLLLFFLQNTEMVNNSVLALLCIASVFTSTGYIQQYAVTAMHARCNICFTCQDSDDQGFW